MTEVLRLADYRPKVRRKLSDAECVVLMTHEIIRERQILENAHHQAILDALRAKAIESH